MKRAWLFILFSSLLMHSFSSYSEEKVLKNGLRIIFSERPSPIASAVILFQAGEADGPPFLATLTNRMLLRGTEIRNRQQIYQEVELAGGKLGTETSFSFSAVYIQAPSENFLSCFDILCECATRASFDSSEIVRTTATLAEGNKPSGFFFVRKGFLKDALLRNKLFSGSQLGRDIPVRPEPYPREQLLEFYRIKYLPENTIVSVSGQVNRKTVLKIVNSYWNDREKKTENNIPRVFSSGQLDSSVTTLQQDRSSDLVRIGFRAPTFFSELFVETFLLEMILADGRAAYFPDRVFTEKKDEIEVQSYYQSEPKMGYFVIEANTPPRKGGKIKDVILAELEKIKKQGLPETCFEIGKRKAESKIAIASQFTILNATFPALAAAGGNQVVLFPDLEERISRFTLSQVNRAAQEIFVHPSVLILQSKMRSK